MGDGNGFVWGHPVTLRKSTCRRFGRAALRLAAVSVVLISTGPLAHAADDDIDADILTPGWSDKFGKMFQGGMTSVTKTMGFGKPLAPPPPEAPSGCPTIAILDGTQSQRVMATGGTDNQGVRYQFSLFTVGRQCTISGGRIALKVGAAGRVLLGPAGTAGQFNVPLRVVVYSELQQKPIESRLFRVSSSVPAGQGGAPFEFVSDSIVVPLGANQNGRDYSIKVGFDSKGTDAARPAKTVRRGHHGKPVQAAAAQ